jgi:Na+-driven multidrug efflux pump
MLMESVFAVADFFFVGRLGADAITTVGIASHGVRALRIVAAGFLFYGDGRC